MNIERILSALAENRIRATADAVAALEGTSIEALIAALREHRETARWVVDLQSFQPILDEDAVVAVDVSENPTVIRDAARLRVLVIATELTASEA